MIDEMSDVLYNNINKFLYEVAECGTKNLLLKSQMR